MVLMVLIILIVTLNLSDISNFNAINNKYYEYSVTRDDGEGSIHTNDDQFYDIDT